MALESRYIQNVQRLDRLTTFKTDTNCENSTIVLHNFKEYLEIKFFKYILQGK